MHDTSTAPESVTEEPTTLVPWSEFMVTDSPARFARVWLQHLVSALPSARSAVVLMLRKETGKLVSAAHWPAAAPVDLSLNQIVDVAVGRKQAVALPRVAHASAESAQLCYPVLVDETVVAVIAIALAPTDDAGLEESMRQVRWSSSWLELFYRRRHGTADSQDQDDLVLLLSIVTAALEHETFAAAATATVNELASVLQCSRVSLGTNQRGFCEVAVVSGASEFAAKAQLLRAVGAAMDEAVDQQASVLHPNFDDASVLLNTRLVAIWP